MGVLHYIAITLALALCLLIGLTRKTNLHTKHTPQRRWMRCAICCSYQNTTNSYCPNHERPVIMLQASERQQRRINYHVGNIWTDATIKRHQTDFIAFTMKLEDMTGDAWTTNAAISVFEVIDPSYLQKFVEFMLGIEEATGKRFDVDDLIKQFLVSEEMGDEQEKVAQN